MRLLQISILGLFFILIFPYLISIYLYITVPVGSACMINYVNNIKYNSKENGFFYIKNGIYHIDTEIIIGSKKIGNVKKCNFINISKGYEKEAYFNEVYCNTVYFFN